MAFLHTHTLASGGRGAHGAAGRWGALGAGGACRRRRRGEHRPLDDVETAVPCRARGLDHRGPASGACADARCPSARWGGGPTRLRFVSKFSPCFFLCHEKTEFFGYFFRIQFAACEPMCFARQVELFRNDRPTRSRPVISRHPQRSGCARQTRGAAGCRAVLARGRSGRRTVTETEAAARPCRHAGGGWRGHGRGRQEGRGTRLCVRPDQGAEQEDQEGDHAPAPPAAPRATPLRSRAPAVRRRPVTHPALLASSW